MGQNIAKTVNRLKIGQNPEKNDENTDPEQQADNAEQDPAYGPGFRIPRKLAVFIGPKTGFQERDDIADDLFMTIT